MRSQLETPGEEPSTPAGARRSDGGPAGRTEFLAFVALVVLIFLGGAAWADQRLTDDAPTGGAYRAASPAEQNATPGHENSPVVRPHPRGLPRRNVRASNRATPRGELA